MRYSVLCAGLAFGLALCGCKGVSGIDLPRTEADLDITAEWPKAREDGFAAGQWQFYQYEGAVMYSGLVDPNGFFHVTGHVVCEGWTPLATLEVTGRDVESDTRCVSRRQVTCKDEPQTVTLPDGRLSDYPHDLCEPPDS